MRSDWSDAVTFESMEYETAYILTRDEYDSWYDNYYLYMVYEISVNQDGSDLRVDGRPSGDRFFVDEKKDGKLLLKKQEKRATL